MRCSKCPNQIDRLNSRQKFPVCFDCKAKSARARHIPKKTKTVLLRLQEQSAVPSPMEHSASEWLKSTNVPAILKLSQEIRHAIEARPQMSHEGDDCARRELQQLQTPFSSALATLSEQSSISQPPTKSNTVRGPYLTKRVLQERWREEES